MRNTFSHIGHSLRFGEWLRIFFACLLFSCSVHAAEQVVAQPATPTPPPQDNILLKIVVFGDSLTSGYQLQSDQAFPAVLERKLKARGYNVIVVNLSVAGDTTTNAVSRLPMVVAQAPDMVIVELGANDALRGVDIEKIMLRNFYKIFNTLKPTKAALILAGMKAPPNMGREYGAYLDKMYQTVSEGFGLTLYPFFLSGVATKPEYNLADGYHPNAEGVALIVDKMMPYIEPLLRWKINVMRHEARLKGAQ